MPTKEIKMRLKMLQQCILLSRGGCVVVLMLLMMIISLLFCGHGVCFVLFFLIEGIWNSISKRSKTKEKSKAK